MPHDKFGPGLLKTFAMHKEQRNRHRQTDLLICKIRSVIVLIK